MDIVESVMEAEVALRSFRSNGENFDKLETWIYQLEAAVRLEKKIFAFGNGGSYCCAEHFAEELTGRFKADRRPLPAIVGASGSHLTCVANDFGFEFVYSRLVDALGKPGDVMLLFSTSGKSMNLIKAAISGLGNDMTVLGLLGGDGGELKQRCTDSIVIPSNDSARIQEVHLVLTHCIVESLERLLDDG